MGHRLLLPCFFLVLVASPGWAENFTDQLHDLINTHKRIVATRATVDSLMEGARVSEKALWPEVSATAFQGHESRNNAEGTANTRLAISEFDVTVTQPLDLWKAKGSAVEISHLQIEQGKLGLEQTTQSVILEAITAVINLKSAMQIEEYARTSVENIKEQAQLEDAKVTKGAGLSTDVLQAKIQLAGAEARLTLSAGALAQASNRYRAVFGYDAPNRADLPTIGLPLQRLPSNKEECVQLALQNNFQIRQLRSAEQLAQTSIRQTRATQFAPDLNFIVDSKFKDNISGIRGATNEWIAKLELKYNFNVAGAAFNNVNSTQHNLIATSNQLQDATNLVEEQAKNTFEQFEITRQNASFLQNQANISGEFLALAREERRLGTRSLIDVLSGETAEINALSDAAAANSQVAIAAYTLLFILGELTVEAVKIGDIALLSPEPLKQASQPKTISQSEVKRTSMKTPNTEQTNNVEPSVQVAANATPQPLSSAEPVEQSSAGREAPLVVNPRITPERPLREAKNIEVSLDSGEPWTQSGVDQMEIIAPTKQEVTAIESLDAPDVAKSAPSKNRTKEIEDSLLATSSNSISEPTVVADAMEMADANTSPVKSPTSPHIEANFEERLTITPEIDIAASRTFISQDPNFQRLWSY